MASVLEIEAIKNTCCGLNNYFWSQWLHPRVQLVVNRLKTLFYNINFVKQELLLELFLFDITILQSYWTYLHVFFARISRGLREYL